MAGMRASSRVGTQNPQAEKVLRACMDLVETLVRQPPENITIMDVETTLNVMHKAQAELDDETPASNAVVASIRNAMGRLQALRAELAK